MNVNIDLRTILFCVVCVLILGFGMTKCSRGKELPETIVKCDTTTLIIHDTVRIDKPVYIDKYIVRTDTILTSTVSHDTVYVELPVEVKVYNDSLYSAQVSGYNANLDWIEVYPRTEYRTITIETKSSPRNKHWGVGVNVGYGAGVYNGSVKFTPYIGVGVQYNLISW